MKKSNNVSRGNKLSNLFARMYTERMISSQSGRVPILPCKLPDDDEDQLQIKEKRNSGKRMLHYQSGRVRLEKIEIVTEIQSEDSTDETKELVKSDKESLS